MSQQRAMHDTIVGCKIPRKDNSPIFFYFCAPPPSCLPGFTRGWPDDWSTQALRIKKSGWLKLVAGFTRKKASTRRVKRKIADSTRNQRVFFSRYLAANSSADLKANRVYVSFFAEFYGLGNLGLTLRVPDWDHLVVFFFFFFLFF